MVLKSGLLFGSSADSKSAGNDQRGGNSVERGQSKYETEVFGVGKGESQGRTRRGGGKGGTEKLVRLQFLTGRSE